MVIVYSGGQFEEETSTEVWVQGSNLAYNIDIYISGITLTDYNCRLVIERPDGESSNELIAILTDNEFYRYIAPSWVTDVAGTVKITTRIKKISDSTIYAQGLVTKSVSEGVLPNEEATITETQYQALLDLMQLLYPLDTTASTTSTRPITNKAITNYVLNLDRVKKALIVGSYGAENYGYLGVGADLKPYYRIVDNASAVPSDTSAEVLHVGNVDTKGNIYNLGTFASLALMLASIQAKTYDKIYRAVVPINSVNFNALIMAKYVNGAFYVSGVAGNYLIFATFNGAAWTTNVKDFLTLAVDKVKLVSVSATGDTAPYTLTVVDSDITSNSFVEIMPNDGIDETTYNDVLAENIYSKLFNVSVGGFEINVKTKNNDAPYLIMYKITEVD